MNVGQVALNAPSAALQSALGVVTIVSIGLALIGWRRRWRMLLVNAAIASAFLGFFWAVTRVRNFEDSLSSTGEAILTGVAVAGIAEFANSLRIWFEGQPPND